MRCSSPLPQVNVRVLGVDVEKKQVALTMRTAEAEANAEAEAAARKEKRGKKPRRSGGDRAAQAASAMALANSGHDDTKFVEGEVASVLDFGAFVRFNTADVMEGLSGEVRVFVWVWVCHGVRSTRSRSDKRMRKLCLLSSYPSWLILRRLACFACR